MMDPQLAKPKEGGEFVIYYVCPECGGGYAATPQHINGAAVNPAKYTIVEAAAVEVV